jgi:hypothetical protein
MSNIKISELESMARDVADARDDLSASLREYEQAVKQLREKHLPEIKEYSEALAVAEGLLEYGVDKSPQLFTRPRSRTVHNVRFGIEKGRGSLSWSISESLLIKRIKRLLPGRVKRLVAVTEKPVKKELEKLKGDELKKLGVTVTRTGDAPFVRLVKSDVHKLAAAIVEESKGK